MRGESETPGLLRRKMPKVKYKERVHDMHAFFAFSRRIDPLRSCSRTVRFAGK